jgi:hypothetical protein
MKSVKNPQQPEEDDAMLEVSRDSDPASSAKRTTVEFVRHLKKIGQPVVLTINGTAELVVQDATSFQMLLELVDRLDTIEAIREGIASVDRGEGRPAEEVLEEMRQKYCIPREP